MITVQIIFEAPETKLEQFLKQVNDLQLVEELRLLEGNLNYRLFRPTDNSNQLLLIDQWKNQQALDNYHNHPLMKKLSKLRITNGLHLVDKQIIISQK